MSKKEVWTDHNGHNIPLKYISAYDKNKEKIMDKLIAKAKALSEAIADFKKMAMKDADKVYELLYKERNMDMPEGIRSFSFYNFNKSLKIEMNVQNVIEFDDRIELAQQKINEFLEKKMEGSDLELAEIVHNAFKTSKGTLDTKRVLSLFSYKIKHPLWLEAMELIKASISTNHTRRYIAFSERQVDGTYKQIQMNFSAL